MYRALYRKWRPQRFEDVVGQRAIVTALKNQITAGRVGHAYLFTGVRGTGKTTCAKIFAKAVNCLHPVNGDPCGECEICKGIDNGSLLDVVEMDAASNNGVDDIRDLRDETAYTPSACQYKVYIIDEVHMLSTAAFNALLKTLEEPPAHVIFILATTEIQKVPATILSRCQRYDFTRIGPEDIARRVEYIAGEEKLELTSDGAELIAALADTGSVLEFGKGHTHAVTALGKMAGRTVAFIYTGKGDTCDNRMKKIARFVRFADCYNIPVVSLVDSTGLKLFDTVERQMAVLSAASTLVYAYSEATTVKVTLVIGNAIGSAYVAMGGSANADMTYAWPGSVISPMTGEAAIQIMWKDKIMASKGDAVKAREELAAQYEAEVADGVNAAVEGLVDDVIDPADSRKMVIAALEILSSKRDSNPPKKHGNMPL